MLSTREYKPEVSNLKPEEESSSTSAVSLQTSTDRRPLLYRALFDLMRHVKSMARGLVALSWGRFDALVSCEGARRKRQRRIPINVPSGAHWSGR